MQERPVFPLLVCDHPVYGSELTMEQPSMITIPVQRATAELLCSARNREAVGRLVDRLVRPGADDPLIAFLERTAAQAAAAGFTEADLEAELAAYNAERRS